MYTIIIVSVSSYAAKYVDTMQGDDGWDNCAAQLLSFMQSVYFWGFDTQTANDWDMILPTTYRVAVLFVYMDFA